LYVDLDGFKAVNDSWGHAAGDDVLRAIAARLAAAVRPEDTVARFGGDEFVVLCEGVSGGGEAMELAGRILAAVARPVPHGAGAAELSASVGLVVSDGRTGAAELIEAADTAMYRAKRGGGDAVEIVEGQLGDVATLANAAVVDDEIDLTRASSTQPNTTPAS
jgi:diguanylate cyclase (GGDEF)-like protein